MKTSLPIRKTALAALLIAAVLFLGGCNLIVKDPVVDAAQVILSINGEEVNKADFSRYLDNAYNRAYEQQQMMQQYGLPAQPINQAQLLKDTLDNTAKDKLLHQKAHELGLDELSPEQEAQLEEEATHQWEDVLEQVKLYYFMGSELEGEALNEAAVKQAEDLGLSLALYIESAKEGSLHEQLHAYAGRDVVITEEELATALGGKQDEDRLRFEADPTAYDRAISAGNPVYYTPAGYRHVRQILISLSEEDQAKIRELENELRPLQTALDSAQAQVDRYEAAILADAPSQEDADFVAAQAEQLGEDGKRLVELLAQEGRTADEQAEVDALKARLPVATALEAARAALAPKQDELTAKEEAAFAAIKERTDEVMALALAEGADFDALIAEYGGDPGQPAAGYLVSQSTTTFVPAFTQGAMALEQPGDISQPIRTNYGYHILRYENDVPEGPVALDSVREALQAELFEARREEIYAQLEAEWLAAADIKLYPERMKD